MPDDPVKSARALLADSLQKYMPVADMQKVSRACDFAEQAHAGVMRKSGEPYITHPMAVATILADMQLGADTIAAALLHDVVEDTPVSCEDIERLFNPVIARLVDGVTKFEDGEDKSVNKAVTFKKIIAATIHDPRVMLIKLADRLHNLLTLDSVALPKRQLLAQETMQTYVPVGRLLGLTRLVDQVELLCLKHIETAWFNRVAHALQVHGPRRQALQAVRSHQLQQALAVLDFLPVIKPSRSDLFIYQQAFGAQTGLSTLLDTIRFELIVSSARECIELAEFLKSVYPGHSFEDRISQPLPGGQQYIDLQVYDSEGPLQLRILTHDMRRTGRFGLLMDEKSANTARAVVQASLKSLEGLIDQDDNPHASMQQLINYLHHDKLIVYTRDGDAIELPQHATVIDFAYKTSLYLGHHLVSATVDGVPVALNSTLKNGQKILLELADEARPHPEWLGYTVTAKARRAIQQYLTNLTPAQQVAVGQEALNQALRLYELDLMQIDAGNWQQLLLSFGLASADQLYLQIATGHLIPQFVASRLCTGMAHEHHGNSLLKNLAGVAYRFAQCCNPIPGDRIFGHLTRRGVAVHRFSCPRLAQERHSNPSHLAALDWQDTLADDVRFSAVIVIHAAIAAEQYTQIIKVAEQEQAGVASLQAVKDGVEVHLVVRNRGQLARVLRQIRLALDFPQISRVLQFSVPA